MAYGEFGGLLPRETAYSSPVAYTEAAKAEAYKRSSYLASMDQFYAELNESTRQFDLNLAWQKESLEKELGLEREKLDLSREAFGLEEEKFEWQKEVSEDEMSLEGRKLDIEEQRMKNDYLLGRGQISASRYATSSQSALGHRELDIKEEEMDFEQALTNLALPYVLQGQELNLQGLSLDNQLKGAYLSEYNQPSSSGSIYTSGGYGAPALLELGPPPSSYIAEP